MITPRAPPADGSIHSWLLEEKMRAETESVVNDIRESLALLRRHL
jgi:hypothetical protein